MTPSRFWLAAAAVAAVSAPSFAASSQTLGGLWDATVIVAGNPIPFQIQLSQDGKGAHGVFFDGERRINPSSAGSFKGGQLSLEFASYATKLNAKLENGVLKGDFGSSRANYVFEARPHRAAPAAPRKTPAIAGVWEIPVDSPKGEKAWRLIVQEKGPKVFATILRIDGDTGTLSGEARGDKILVSHFAGERPGLLEITPKSDGTLGLVLTDGSGKKALQALRPEAARKGGLAAPDDPTRHTSVKDPNEPLRFSAADLTGRQFSQTDPRFKGKVVLLNITGSWCPNCHDEAPFLAALYDKYRAKGLEIVGLDFEQPDQLKDPWRLKAFIKKYKLNYTVLLAGDTKDLNAKLPQAVNLHAWPTTFFIGRDGKVKSVHVGFTSPGSAGFDAKLRAEVTREVEALLAEKG
jgi:peroxiredoxin